VLRAPELDARTPGWVSPEQIQIYPDPPQLAFPVRSAKATDPVPHQPFAAPTAWESTSSLGL